MSRSILIIICIFLIVLIGFFLVVPKYKKFETLKQKIDGKETELRYIESYFSDLERLSQKLKEHESQLSKIDFALPSDSSLSLLSLINFLQTANSQNGLVFKKLSSFSITSPKIAAKAPVSIQPQPLSKIKEIHLGFEVSGSYSALKNFLETLEKSARLIEVENISFSFEEGKIFSFNLKIKTYSY